MPRAFPSDTAARFLLRLPLGMRDKLAEAAKISGRSMNAEVVARLEKSLDEVDEFASLQEYVGKLADRLVALERRLDDAA